MALFHANFYSETLKMQSNANVILPAKINPAKKLPVLYLLHGLSDDHTMWQRRTSIERYAADLPLAIVMPNAHRSFYTDMAHGASYFTYVADELPLLMRSYFPISERREDNFVAGLSMGGYGAFKLALNRPAQYAAAASLSGALNIGRRLEEAFPDVLANAFASPAEAARPPHNLFAVAERSFGNPAGVRTCPALFQCCGTEDHLYQDNLDFRDHAIRLKLPLVYSDGPGGHMWDYWDARIRDVLAWLPLDMARGLL